MDRESAFADAAGSWLGAFDDEVQMTRPRRRALVAIGLGEFVDAYDLIVIGGLSFALESHFRLSSGEFAWLTAAAFFGSAVGALFFGDVADRIGRRRVFLLNLVAFVGLALLSAVVTIASEVKREHEVAVSLAFEGSPRNYVIPGHDSRLGQVMNNLIDNARSFSPNGGTVRVTCRRTGDDMSVIVEDDGPGIRPDALEKIFERFYTDRPDDGFGQNSGLGLSISRQIVQAHSRRIWAENRPAPKDAAPPDPERMPPVSRSTRTICSRSAFSRV